jgi:hypothetical protein
VNCVRQDEDIERLWEYWCQDDPPAQLARLGIDAVIAPNFSHLQGVPKLESVGNRMRHLMCAGDFARAGLLAVPHLSVIDPANWDWWIDYLRRNRSIWCVAFEFETGYKKRVEGEDAVARLAAVQAAVGRPLHLVAVGGTQYRTLIRSRFTACSFIDASPFWNSAFRQRGRIDGGQVAWDRYPLPPAAPLDALMEHNLRTYTEWFAGPDAAPES